MLGWTLSLQNVLDQRSGYHDTIACSSRVLFASMMRRGRQNGMQAGQPARLLWHGYKNFRDARFAIEPAQLGVLRGHTGTGVLR